MINKRQTITAVIPAKNEQTNIKRCIKSVQWCDRIVILWMGNDNTAKIAQKLGAEVFEMNKSKNDDFIIVQKNINWAIENCKTDWILRIDADEEVTEDLKKEIIDILKFNVKRSTLNIIAYGIPRNQFFFGGFLKGGDWAYDRLVRLFKPESAKYHSLVHVHEQLKIRGTVSYLKNYLIHYSHPDLNTAIKKFNTYTSVQINDLKDNYFQAILKMFFLPPYIFLRWMIWHHGYRDGLRGVVAGLFRAWYEFILYAKYLEKIIAI